MGGLLAGAAGGRVGAHSLQGRTAWSLPCSECGAAFTSKLEGMFKDMELSKDIMVHFKQVSGVASGDALVGWVWQRVARAKTRRK